MDSLKFIPLPPTSTIPLPRDNEPKLVITSSTSGERSVCTVRDDGTTTCSETSVSTVKDDGVKMSHKEKKKHKKEKHKHKHKHKDKDKSREKKKSHPFITPQVLSQHASAIKAAMLKEVQNDNDSELSQTIVDDLFKDFLASKMNEIESAYKQAAERKDSGGGEIANSVEEMNKLLDDELDSISQNTPSPVKKSAKTHSSSSSQEKKVEQTLDRVSPPIKSIKPKDIISSSVTRPEVKSPNILTMEKDNIGQDTERKVKSEIVSSDIKNLGCEEESTLIRKESDKDKITEDSLDKLNVPLETKKTGKFQLAFKISQTSAELISSGSKVGDLPKKSLEEGEVISSGHGSSSDSDSADGDNEDNEGDISETGSLSDSDKDKSKKKKKKKKHKKKKKKHKISKEKEKDESDSRSKRKHSSHRSRSRSKTPKKHRRSRTPSREKRKRSSRSRSFSPEHGAWKPKSPPREKKKRERSISFSPEHGVWRSNKHKHDREISRERDKDNWKYDHDRDRNYDKHRKHDRERDYDSHRYDRDKDYDREKDYDRDRRSRERECEKKDSERRYGKWRSRSRSRERKKDRNSTDLRLKIDKAKLREIAMKNALAMAKAGQGSIPGIDFASIKAGGKSIDELTEFCARIAAKEKLKNRPAGLTSSSSSDDDGKKTDDDELIHHPFKVTEKAITMNIRNAIPMPIYSAQEKITQQATLRLQFPVSSGNVHRTKEIEWVPVEKTETVKTSTVTGTTPAVAMVATTAAGTTTTSTPAVPAVAVATEVKLMPVKEEDKVFVETPSEPVDISSIISERIKAARKLAENPRDTAAMSAMQKAQHNANLWANSKNLPGKFVGSTGAQILSQDELMGPDKKRQAWAKKAIADVTRYRRYRKTFSTIVVKKLVLKSLAIADMKDQFNRAAPVKGGIGMALLQKMGWQQGTGLGKHNEGKLEPLALDFKMDRKGLTSQDEHRPNKRVPAQGAPVRKDLSGKHPVSALVELCNKRRWASPDFQIVHEGGPDHKKNFLFRVIVNGVEYQPSTASQNKKTAKAHAATAVLQEMGLVPRDT